MVDDDVVGLAEAMSVVGLRHLQELRLEQATLGFSPAPCCPLLRELDLKESKISRIYHLSYLIV